MPIFSIPSTHGLSWLNSTSFFKLFYFASFHGFMVNGKLKTTPVPQSCASPYRNGNVSSATEASCEWWWTASVVIVGWEDRGMAPRSLIQTVRLRDTRPASSKFQPQAVGMSRKRDCCGMVSQCARGSNSFEAASQPSVRLTPVVVIIWK